MKYDNKEAGRSIKFKFLISPPALPELAMAGGHSQSKRRSN